MAVNCSYFTPDDEYEKYPKHVEWSCNKIKILVLHFLDISWKKLIDYVARILDSVIYSKDRKSLAIYSK
jgi:hypothetical protein